MKELRYKNISRLINPSQIAFIGGSDAEIAINEAKRRLMVEIRHKIAKSKKGKGLIYKNIKKPTTVTLEPIELYQALGKLSYSKLKNLNKTLLQSRKQ